MTKEKLEELRELTKNHDEFSVMQTYFFDHFGDHREFADRSQRTRNLKLEAMIQQVLENVSPLKKIKLINLMMMRFVPTDLVHGAAQLSGGGLITFYFFGNENIGMAAVKTSFANDETLFARIKEVVPDGDGALFKKKDLNMN
jgi:hypothetical protein